MMTILFLAGLVFWVIPTFLKSIGKKSPPITDWDMYCKEKLKKKK